MSKRKKRGRPANTTVEREPNGRAARSSTTRQRREDAQRPALEARAKALGIFIPKPKRMTGETMEEFAARSDARDAAMRAATPVLKREWSGCAVGQAIADESDAVELWEATKLIRRVRAAYLAAIGAPSERARIAAFAIAPTEDPTQPEARMQPSEPRTPEEAAASACAAWESLRDVLLGLGPMTVRFTIDRICAEVPGADGYPVPKAPVLAILRHVHEKLVR